MPARPFARSPEPASAYIVCHLPTPRLQDFVELTSDVLVREGFLLHDSVLGSRLSVHSLLELELGRSYTTARGNSLCRTSRTEALLAGSVHISVDTLEPPRGSADTPTRSSLEEDEAETADGSSVDEDERDESAVGQPNTLSGALRCVRLLRANPGEDSLLDLERTLHRLPDANDWLRSFLALDGVQATTSPAGASLLLHASEAVP
eukprot:6198118-Pleurochrysis_carterae.AAC.6